MTITLQLIDPQTPQPDIRRASFALITESILIRLQKEQHEDSDWVELAELFTDWWCAVVQMNMSWKEKENAAKALVFFRHSYRSMPRTTARELRLRSQHILNAIRSH